MKCKDLRLSIHLHATSRALMEGNDHMRVKRLAALMVVAGTTGLAACSSSAGSAASLLDPSTSSAASPTAAGSGTALPAGGPSAADPGSSGESVHHVTFSRTTEDGYSYHVDVSVALGKPTIDPTQADPGTTDIVLPITLEGGTLTNTTPGGHDMSTDVDNISGLSLFVGPSLPESSYTCAIAKTSLAFIQITDVTPYGGCGREVDNLIPQGSDPMTSVQVAAGQSIPLSLLQEDSEQRPGAVTVNVPEADAAKIAADFGSAQVCVLLGTYEGVTVTYSAGTCG
jgi:hypothetical protein